MALSWQHHRFPLGRMSFLAAFGAASFTCIGAVMAATNPTPGAYSRYATHQLTHYAESNICAEAPAAFGLKEECRSLLKSNRAEIQDFIMSNTDRRNFFFFSVYTTDLAIASFLPTYQLQTIGLFQGFYVFNGEAVEI
ncbi:DUF4359 domain-containing protein [Phormidium sp. CLA17]|uniref:DUF4359 domain-containing protein n=1 Tax=Leptolyngbya sp. Cla-17 TaxID=2803751 RepID=UPI00149295E2|nr:DUF4359 domain-containing protein [Leptolyngbya sp. Cla-17]MBM0742756.1 DUF4359 domain-containing protein [Leptolyngbya sp. Cla-17]